MKQRLRVGTMRPGPGWRTLLGQLGVRSETISAWNTLSPENYSALIVNLPPDPEQLTAIESYLKAGGAVLDGGGFLPAVERGGFSRRHLRTLFPHRDDTVFGDVGPLDLDATVSFYGRGNHLDGSIYLGEYEGGYIAYVPFPFEKLLTAEGSARKQFYAASPRFPNEIVSTVSKGELRRVVELALRWLHLQRGLPYIQLQNSPGNGEGIFCYRIDSDYGTREQVLSLHDVAQQKRTRLTWFLHVEAHADWLGLFKSFAGDEMALHGYRHKTFKGGEENLANISEAGSMFDRHGIRYSGFSAPNGFWNLELGEAIDTLGIGYSSEFAYDYDNLPSYPWLRGRFSSTLQLPVHPICIGSFIRAKASSQVMKEYFREVIDRKIYRREPVILYHHPGHETWDVMADSLAYAREKGLVNLTMGEYAAWWRRRGAVRFDATIQGEELSIVWRDHDPAVALRIERSVEEHATLPCGDRYDLSRLDWNRTPQKASQWPADISRIRRFNPLLIRQSIEDFNARARQ